MNVSDFFKQLRTMKVGDKPWFSETVFRKVWMIGRLKIRAEMRSKKGYMGRFGGGWQYKIGVDIGGRTVLVNLLIMTVVFTRLTKEEAKNAQ